mgnify:CR=1 FL=1
MIKTFRGLLPDGAQERIRLQTLDGKKGYRIKKFELMLWKPGIVIQESVVEIHSILPPAPTGIVNFSDQTLLAAGFLGGYTSVANSTVNWIVTFDGVIFNQDIFVTHSEVDGNLACNYYLELETISLDDVEATAVILKNFRNTNTTA